MFGGLKEKIECKELNFSYVKEAPVLKGLTLRIDKGKVTALVGSTGSGKTTIVNLLLRFYDCPQGQIFVDNTDIRDFDIKSLRSHMSLVSQDAMLFNDTLHSNIIYGLKDISDEEVRQVIKKARLWDFVSSLPEGLDTYVGDRGVKLSGGEKQRVVIARALLKNAPIIILDEATSSLDTRTETMIQEAIQEAIRDRTTIVVAHRLSTIQHADKIVVIEDGTVAEEGGLTELLDKKGKFWQYWQAQKFF